MDCPSQRVDSKVEMMRGCEGVMGKLQTHWHRLYKLSATKSGATAHFVPRWIKKIIFSVCFITENHFSQIRADKSFTEARGRVWAAAFQWNSAFVRVWIVWVLQNTRVCARVCFCNCRLESQQEERRSQRLSLYLGCRAAGSMIKTLNQTPS